MPFVTFRAKSLFTVLGDDERHSAESGKTATRGGINGTEAEVTHKSIYRHVWMYGGFRL